MTKPMEPPPINTIGISGFDVGGVFSTVSPKTAGVGSKLRFTISGSPISTVGSKTAMAVGLGLEVAEGLGVAEGTALG